MPFIMKETTVQTIRHNVDGSSIHLVRTSWPRDNYGFITQYEPGKNLYILLLEIVAWAACRSVRCLWHVSCCLNISRSAVGLSDSASSPLLSPTLSLDYR